jgi:hypothetical protein
MEMNLASSKVRGLIQIRNTVKNILPGDVSIYGLDEPHDKIFVLDIEESGGMEEVSIYYEDEKYVINFWTCKPSIPHYHVWLAKYIACVSLLIDGNPSVQELECQVLFDDGGTEDAVCLREAMVTLMEILKESMDLPR